MAEPRTFYGGEPVTGAHPQGGEIGAGKYDGPEAHVQAPWKCPACLAENSGPLHQGCVNCGAGKPGYHIGLPPMGEPPPAPLQVEDPESAIYAVAEAWARDRDTTIVDAFVAGYHMARRQILAHMPQPDPAALPDLPVEAKPQRTIIAALELFRDQVLSVAEEEIASGEWCSIVEVNALIERMKAQL